MVETCLAAWRFVPCSRLYTNLPSSSCSPSSSSSPHLSICVLIWETERESLIWETHWSVAFCLHPSRDGTYNHRHVPRPEIEPTTLWCAGRCSNKRSHQPGKLAFLWSGMVCFNLTTCYTRFCKSAEGKKKMLREEQVLEKLCQIWMER